METAVYVDVLLVLNYVTTAALLAATAKLLGIEIQRRRIVGAALLGAMGSLAIFLPFMGFFPLLCYRILLSGAIVIAALPWAGWVQLVKGWAMFFAVNFFFAGVMLGIWMLFAPSGMIYYNGIVYFNINPVMLLASTAAAYALLGLARRLSRAGRIPGTKCRITVTLDSKSCSLDGLIDTGNSLYEPFSGAPVFVCPLGAVKGILTRELAGAIRGEDLELAAIAAGRRIRMVPYAAMGSRGTLPALRVDELIIHSGGNSYTAQLCYMAISSERIGEGGRVAILNPDLLYSHST